MEKRDGNVVIYIGDDEVNFPPSDIESNDLCNGINQETSSKESAEVAEITSVIELKSEIDKNAKGDELTNVYAICDQIINPDSSNEAACEDAASKILTEKSCKRGNNPNSGNKKVRFAKNLKQSKSEDSKRDDKTKVKTCKNSRNDKNNNSDNDKNINYNKNDENRNNNNNNNAINNKNNNNNKESAVTNNNNKNNNANKNRNYDYIIDFNNSNDSNNNNKNNNNNNNNNSSSSYNNNNNNSIKSCDPHAYLFSTSAYFTPKVNSAYLGTNFGNRKQTKVESYSLLASLLKYISEVKKREVHPLASFVPWFHYRFGVIFFFFAFAITWFGIYANNVIVCVNAFNADASVSDMNLNFCYSYSYLEMEKSRKRYILFYRWVHFGFLILSTIFYVPRLMMKKSGNEHLKKLFAQLSDSRNWLKEETRKHNQKCIVEYMRGNYGGHKMLFLSHLLIHGLCFTISCLGFAFLNFVLQGTFWTLPSVLVPLKRDSVNFSDPLSRLFPPFVTCYIGKEAKILVEREDTFYCHLPLMEFYEKLFVVTWGFLFFAASVGAFGLAKIIFSLAEGFLYKGKVRLCDVTSRTSSMVKADQMSKVFDFGDVFILRTFRKFVNENEFGQILDEVKEIVRPVGKEA